MAKPIDRTWATHVRFLNERPTADLTYSDVLMVPNRSGVASRLDVDPTSTDGLATPLPLMVANTTAVSGRRVTETMARRGGLAIFPQDVPMEVVAQSIAKVKQSHPVFDTAVTVSPHTTVGETIGLMAKRSHGVVAVVESGRIVGLVHPQDATAADRFTQTRDVMTGDIITVSPDTVPEQVFDSLVERHQKVALAVDPERLLVGIMTSKGALRSTLYTPALDEQGRLHIGVAIGIGGDVTAKVRAVLEAQADVLVMDTAHGHQGKMITTLELAREECDRSAERTGRRAPIVAGNVVTADGVRDLVGARADVIKASVGPDAMYTTRMQIGVGRSQFSAVFRCLGQARRSDCAVWADDGVKHSRDVALALTTGADSVMIGPWSTGTHESTDDQLFDHEGWAYEGNFGMASARVVRRRTRGQSAFDRTRATLFEEGISSLRMHLDPQHPGVEDLLGWITSGMHSSATYTGARTLAKFNNQAVIGV